MADQTPLTTESAEVTHEYGLRIDCARNGCEEPHGDDGYVLPRGIESEAIERVNGHAVTFVVRSVTRSPWRDLVSNPPDDCLCLGVNVCSTCDDETPLSDDDPRYRCLTCRRVVDPELEPSAGAPLRCPDCHADAERDGRL